MDEILYTDEIRYAKSVEGDWVRIVDAWGFGIKSYLWQNGAWVPGGNVAETDYYGMAFSPEKVASILGPEAIALPVVAK